MNIEPFCECTQENRRVIIDCTVNTTYPRPERHAAQFDELYRHWTISPHYLHERQLKGLIVNFLTCCVCHRRVIR